ncbi:hypothetical protein FRC08_018709, partial [Ceratobasidium sp. 394]
PYIARPSDAILTTFDYSTGPDSRAGTIIRGNSYFEANGKTYDITYGQDDAKKLVKADPGNAIWNADSYEYL